MVSCLDPYLRSTAFMGSAALGVAVAGVLAYTVVLQVSQQIYPLRDEAESHFWGECSFRMIAKAEYETYSSVRKILNATAMILIGATVATTVGGTVAAFAGVLTSTPYSLKVGVTVLSSVIGSFSAIFVDPWAQSLLDPVWWAKDSIQERILGK